MKSRVPIDDDRDYSNKDINSEVINHLTSKNTINILVASKTNTNLYNYFLENHTVNTLKFFEGKISGSYCDIGEIISVRRVIGDFTHSNIIYILDDQNGIHVIEQKQQSGDGSAKVD
jgi:hypothetical protein